MKFIVSCPTHYYGLWSIEGHPVHEDYALVRLDPRPTSKLVYRVGPTPAGHPKAMELSVVALFELDYLEHQGSLVSAMGRLKAAIREANSFRKSMGETPCSCDICGSAEREPVWLRYLEPKRSTTKGPV